MAAEPVLPQRGFQNRIRKGDSQAPSPTLESHPPPTPGSSNGRRSLRPACCAVGSHPGLALPTPAPRDLCSPIPASPRGACSSLCQQCRSRRVPRGLVQCHLHSGPPHHPRQRPSSIAPHRVTLCYFPRSTRHCQKRSRRRCAGLFHFSLPSWNKSFMRVRALPVLKHSPSAWNRAWQNLRCLRKSGE